MKDESVGAVKKCARPIDRANKNQHPAQGADLILGLATAKSCLILLNSNLFSVCYKSAEVISSHSYTTNCTVL